MNMFRSFLEKIGISKIERQEIPKEPPTPEKKEPAREPSAIPTGKDYQVGDRIEGRYEIYRILGGEGQSGMGILYVCLDHESRNVLVLKTFQKQYLSSNKVRDSFKREALAWINIDKHSFIVRAKWVHELDHRMFVGAEFIAPDDEGRNTLTHYFTRPISLQQALTWSIQFCHGMEHAYERGVTPHRDIKPDNIMITREGVLKITDFGLAGIWENADLSLDAGEWSNQENKGLSFIRNTDGKIIGGTHPYMSPEQFEGQADVRSDIYSFGIVMFQMINKGKLPFYPEAGVWWSMAQWYEAHKIQRLSKVDSPLFPIVQKCLHKDAGKRYPAFQDLRKDLEHMFNSEITSQTGEAVPLPPEAPELEAWELIWKGISLKYLGLIDDAIASFRKAFSIDPKYTEAHDNLGFAVVHNSLGEVLHAKGLVDDAIASFRKAISIDPEYIEAYYNLGIALYGKGLVDDAIASFRKAISIDPEYTEAYYNLGVALYGKGLVDDAIASFRKAIRFNPEHAKAHNNLGIALNAKGLFDEAITCWCKAIKINPEDAVTHNNLGIALVAKGLDDDAIVSFREAIRINPEFAGAHNNLGDALQKKGLPDAAMIAFREALRIDPKLPEAYYNIGEALENKSMFSDAIAAYESFIECAPPQYAEYVAQVKARIEKLKGNF